MIEIVDLSQEIFSGMPVFSGLPEVEITLHASHEQWEGITGSDVISPAVNRLEMGEHTGTHVDAISHMARQYRGQSIDTMPLTMFYTEGICLDLRRAGLHTLREPDQSVPTDRPRAVPLHRPAAQDPGRNRLAGAGRRRLRG